MTLEEKINQLFFITPEALTDTDPVTVAGERTKEALEKHPVGGIIYFTKNINNETQIKEMISATKAYASSVCPLPLFIGIDEEGGTVSRLADCKALSLPDVGNMSDIGKSADPENAYRAGCTLGQYLSTQRHQPDRSRIRSQ